MPEPHSREVRTMSTNGTWLDGRCTAVGPRLEGREHQGPIPCDLDERHKGLHRWAMPFSFFEVEWRGMDASGRVVKGPA